MPPSMGGTSFPQLSGQSEMARDAPLLVTRAPATTSSRVHNAVNTAKRRSPGEGIGNRCRESGAGFSKGLPLELQSRAGWQTTKPDCLSHLGPECRDSRDRPGGLAYRISP